MQQLNTLITLQLTLFALLFVGGMCRKYKIISPEVKRGMTDLFINIILPCNIIYSFQVSMDRNLLIQSGLILIISLGIQLFSYGISYLLYPKVPQIGRAHV